MLSLNRNLVLNKVLLVVGLTWIRLPRLFDLENNPWILIFTLLPFWYVIISNHLLSVSSLDADRRVVLRLAVNTAVIFNLLGLLLVISTLFVKAFVEEVSAAYQAIAILLLLGSVAGGLVGFRVVVRKLDFDPALAILGAIYYLLIIAALFRTSTYRPFLLLTIFQLVTVIAFAFSSRHTLGSNATRYLIFVVYGLLLYLALNIILHWSGIQNPAENYLREFDAVMLSWLGITAARVYFPMAEGINSLGMVGGAGLAFCSVLVLDAWRKGSKNWQAWAGAVLGSLTSLYTILLTDSRGGLVFGFIAAGLIAFPFLYQQAGLLVGSLLLQIGVLFQGELVSNLPLLARFSRSGSDVLSGRSAIWASAAGHLAHFQPIHLVGYGMYGQTNSGVVRLYQDIFSSYVNSSVIPLHHFFLQTIFDLGYLGLMAALLFLFLLGRNLQKELKARAANLDARLALAGLFFCLLVGSVSSIPSYYAREIFYLLPFIWVAASSKQGLSDE